MPNPPRAEDALRPELPRRHPFPQRYGDSRRTVAAIFQPSVLDWLFGGGIGTNIGASIFWALVAGALGYWLKGHLHAMREHLRVLHESHAELHRKLDRHASTHAAAIEALHQRISGDAR